MQQKLCRKMAIKSMKLSIKLRALSKGNMAFTSREQSLFYNAKCLPNDIPKPFYSRSIDKCKTSRIVAAACRMCDELIHKVQKEWTTESEVESDKNFSKTELLLQTPLPEFIGRQQLCFIRRTSLYQSTNDVSNRISIRQPNRKM